MPEDQYASVRYLVDDLDAHVERLREAEVHFVSDVVEGRAVDRSSSPTRRGNLIEVFEPASR